MKFIWKLQMQNRQMHLILRWRLTLNKRRIQNPVEYLRWSFFAKIFKGWLIITLPCGRLPAQVLLSQHLLVQSQEWKPRKIYESCSKLTITHQSDVSDVVQVSSFLTLNRFYTLFRCLHRWLWTSKFRLGQTCTL